MSQELRLVPVSIKGLETGDPFYWIGTNGHIFRGDWHDEAEKAFIDAQVYRLVRPAPTFDDLEWPRDMPAECITMRNIWLFDGTMDILCRQSFDLRLIADNLDKMNGVTS